MTLGRLRNKLQDAALDAFIITQPENRRYLSGFTGSAGLLLVTATRQLLFTDSRYYEQVKRQSPDWELVECGYDMVGALAELLPDLGLSTGKIGFEADNLIVSEFEAWKVLLAEVELIGKTQFVSDLRVVKTASDLVAIKKAMAIADRAMAHIYAWIQPGMSEKEVAWELEVFMRTHGADALSFETTVAAGANAALPHAKPTDSLTQPGEVVLIDMGCKVDGYCSDMTRTFSLGRPKHTAYEAVWRVVDQANKAATAGIKAGVSGKAVDRLARDVIDRAGYGDKFGHGLGHGVGLAIHEDPFMSFRRDAILPEGAVITVEPGIYLPGKFGVRLEDMVIITQDGVEVLTTTPKIPILDR